jgi:hypothetical protein
MSLCDYSTDELAASRLGGPHQESHDDAPEHEGIRPRWPFPQNQSITVSIMVPCGEMIHLESFWVVCYTTFI